MPNQSIEQLPVPLSINKNPQEVLIKSIEGKPSPHLDFPEPVAISHASENPNPPPASGLNPITEDLHHHRRHPDVPPASETHCSSTPTYELEGTQSGVPFLVKPKPKSSQRWFLCMILNVVNSKCIAPRPLPFKFCLSKDAACFNHELLKSYNGDVNAIIRSSPFSPMSYGLEFKDTSVLQNLFQFHPDWMNMKSILMNGNSYPLKPPLPKHIQLGDLQEMTGPNF